MDQRGVPNAFWRNALQADGRVLAPKAQVRPTSLLSAHRGRPEETDGAADRRS